MMAQPGLGYTTSYATQNVGLMQPTYTTTQAGYTTVMQDTYTQPVAKPARSPAAGSRTFKHSSHLTAQEALTKAHSMHAEVQELENTITAQQDEIAWLKEKLLHHKRKTLEKYFVWDEDFAKQAHFHEWKHFMQKQKKLREIDGLHSAREQDRGEMMRKVQELQAQLMDMENAYQQLTQQEAATRDKLGKAEQLIRTVAGATTEYDMDTPAKVPTQVDGEAGFMKQKLHSLLSEVDAQYINPLKVLNVNDQVIGATVMEGSPTQGQCTVGFAPGMVPAPATVTAAPMVARTVGTYGSIVRR